MTTIKTKGAVQKVEAAGPGQQAWGQRIQQILVFASLIILFAYFSFASPYFFNWSNVTGILMATSVTGIMALGATFVIATSGIDLSVGTGMTLTSVMTATCLNTWGLPLWVGVAGGIVTGGLIGLVNGLNIALLKLPPFIATLASMMVAAGLSLIISNATPIYTRSVSGFRDIAQGTLVPGLPEPGLPNAVLIFIAAAVLASVLLSKTLIGRYALSIGSNEEATAISGIDVRRWKYVIYIVAGLFTGLAGVVMTSRLNGAQPALGQGYELEAIAAVVIGGRPSRAARRRSSAPSSAP